MVRAILAMVIGLATLTACAHAYVPTAVDPGAPNDAGILSLMGRFEDGHACAVSPTLALSCAHLPDVRPFDHDTGLYATRYEDGAGASGVLSPIYVTSSCDLAMYSGEFNHYYVLAKAPPALGEHLRLMGYDWRDKRRAFGPRPISAKVLRVIAGHLILDTDPVTEPGSSGSCVLNDRDEIVAINCFGKQMKSLEQVGIVVGVWGEWGANMLAQAEEAKK